MFEALEYLEECISDDEDLKIYIQPPEVEAGILSGEDDADEDAAGIADNVCSRQLKGGCEIVTSRRRLSTAAEEDEGDNVLATSESLLQGIDISCYEQPSTSSSTHSLRLRRVEPSATNRPLPKAVKDTVFKWRKDTAAAMVPIFPPPNFEDCKELHPHEQFEKFFDDDLIGHICEESEKYAVFLGKPNPNITADEVRCFIGILIISGYNTLTSMRSYWSIDDDVRNDCVANAMRRNRFLQIHKFLHFEDSNKTVTNGDKMWKLRPITDHLKANMIKHFHPEQNLSYDESMIGYFGRHGCKQFIRGKPLRFGYKIWSLCTPNGYLVNFEIYQGKNPRSEPTYEQRFGKCTAPLINMIDDFSPDVQQLPFSFYFDNLFTGLPLLLYLKSRGYNGTGTIRENRIPKSCPLPTKKNMQKQKRGYMKSSKMAKAGIILTSWKDNNVVNIASTAFGVNPVSTVQRYSREQSKRIQLPRPCVIAEYNKYMCGVDRMDQNISLYRIAIRGKKWWSAIFTFLVDACIQNAWLLHRTAHPEMPQAEFRRHIDVYYCKHYGVSPENAGPARKRKSDESPTGTLRFDGMHYYPAQCNKRRRCAGEFCKSVGRIECLKCDVGLCLKCFKQYHTVRTKK